MSSVSDSPSFRTYIYNDNRYLPMLYLYSTYAYVHTTAFFGSKVNIWSIINLCSDMRWWEKLSYNLQNNLRDYKNLLPN